MTTAKWGAPADPEAIFTTELNSLADGSRAITSSAVSNDAATERYMYATFTLNVATQSGARDGHVELYVLPTWDDTNQAYGSSSRTPSPNHLVGVFALDAATTSGAVCIEGVLIPPTDFDVLLINESGQALASSGNTLYMTRYNVESG